MMKIKISYDKGLTEIKCSVTMYSLLYQSQTIVYIYIQRSLAGCGP